MRNTIPKIAVVIVAALAAGTSMADEFKIKASIERTFSGAKVDSIRRTPVPGVWEVIVGDDVVYSNDTGEYLFQGNLIDSRERKNMTEEVRNRLAVIDVKNLPMQLAIKQTKGDGSRMIITFEDPNCGYCKRQQQQLASIQNVTIYTFLTPILSQDSMVKSKAIWCSGDKAKAWSDMMWSGSTAQTQVAGCEAPIQQLLSLSQRLNVKGTPTIVFQDGSRVPGYMKAADIEARLAQVVAARSNTN